MVVLLTSSHAQCARERACNARKSLRSSRVSVTRAEQAAGGEHDTAGYYKVTLAREPLRGFQAASLSLSPPPQPCPYSCSLPWLTRKPMRAEVTGAGSGGADVMAATRLIWPIHLVMVVSSL